MRKLILFFLFTVFMGLEWRAWGQPWAYDFGTGTGTHTTGSSTSFLPSPPSGTARVRIGTGGGSINLDNPGTSLGTQTELRIVAATGTSTNKAGIYDWSSPSTVAYARFLYRTTSASNGNLNFSMGANSLGSDNNGYTGSYNNALVSFTISYNSGSISSVVRRSSGSNTTINSHGFFKDQDQIIEVYANNSSSSVSYFRNGTDYSLPSQTWDLWVDGTQVVTNGAKASTWTVNTNISGFAFYAESSNSNSAAIYVDDIEYSNSLPSSSNYIQVWDGDFSTNSNWNTRVAPTSGNTATVNANSQISSNATVNNITISTGKTLSIENSGSLTVSGTLTNSGTLTLKSDASGTASLIHSTSGVNATVERYVAGHGNVADAGWHLMGSPVASFNISGSSFQPGSNDDLYGWSESTKMWLNYKAGDPTQIVPGTGYLVAYENNSTKTFSGNLNVSDVSFSDLSYTPTQGNGWHLLGNPFASALKWNDGNWSLTNVASTAKIWNSTNKSYTDISANDIIPSAQGFFVQVSSSTNSLTIPATARVHSSTNWYKASDVPMLKLTARPSDGSSAQETIIRLEPEATLGNDFYWDSRFLAGYAPQLYSSVENTKLSTNALPAVEEEQEIVLGFEKNQHSNFSIELTENTLDGVVYLKDLKLGITHNLSQQPVYTFSSAEGDDPLRFKLSFASVGIGEQQATVPYVWYGNEKLHLQNAHAETVVEVYTVQGQRIMRSKVLSNEVLLKVNSGVYLIKILQPMQQNVQKIVIH